MALYAIGDVQGCDAELGDLLGKLKFSANRDSLWFVGDLVNRGPDSLKVLRRIRDLGDAATVILGNHDLHLLAVACGATRARRDDTLEWRVWLLPIAWLIEWLKTRPLIHDDLGFNVCMVPVIIQAGQSGPGMDLAAHYADLQFSTRRTMASMKAHRTELDGRLAKFGRQPRAAGILWSVRIQVADSEEQARAMEEHYLDSIPPEAGLIELSSMYGLDFSRFRRDMRLSDVAAEVKAQNVHWGSFEEILKTTDPNLTVEQFGRRFMTERILVAGGTPKMIVDKLEQWHFETGANGGFMLARGFSAPGNLQEFVDHVVPELQRRGLSKKKYAGATLRENLCTRA